MACFLIRDYFLKAKEKYFYKTVLPVITSMDAIHVLWDHIVDQTMCNICLVVYFVHWKADKFIWGEIDETQFESGTIGQLKTIDLEVVSY